MQIEITLEERRVHGCIQRILRMNGEMFGDQWFGRIIRKRRRILLDHLSFEYIIINQLVFIKQLEASKENVIENTLLNKSRVINE